MYIKKNSISQTSTGKGFFKNNMYYKLILVLLFINIYVVQGANIDADRHAVDFGQKRVLFLKDGTFRIIGADRRIICYASLLMRVRTSPKKTVYLSNDNLNDVNFEYDKENQTFIFTGKIKVGENIPDSEYSTFRQSVKILPEKLLVTASLDTSKQTSTPHVLTFLNRLRIPKNISFNKIIEWEKPEGSRKNFKITEKGSWNSLFKDSRGGIMKFLLGKNYDLSVKSLNYIFAVYAPSYNAVELRTGYMNYSGKKQNRKTYKFEYEINLLEKPDSGNISESSSAALPGSSLKQQAVRIPKNNELYVVPPVIEEEVLPGTREIPGYKDNLIRVIGCPDQYVPATFVVRPKTNLSLLPESGDLHSKDKVISAKNVDIRIVKCWYQQGGRDYSKRIPAQHYTPMMAPSGQSVLVPELLLKDPGLVKVDYKKKTNWVKISKTADGRACEQYVNVSDPKGISDKNGHKMGFSRDYFPVRDSNTLLPVTIPAGKNQQFWVTIHIPETAGAGIYKGKITLKDDGKSIGFFNLELRVLPFKLLPPYYLSSMSHLSFLRGKGSQDKFMSRNEQQYLAELKNLLAHGISNPTLTHSLVTTKFTPELFEKTLTIRKELGMNKQPLFYEAHYGVVYQVTQKKKSLAWLKQQVKKVIKIAKKYGFTEVYFYGLDEKEGSELTAQRPIWNAVKEAGGKIFVAGRGKAHYDAMGDLNDFFRSDSYPSREYTRLWHGKKHKICVYNNPQCGFEQPLAYRRNFGLLLWQYDYDGAMDFAYYVAVFGHLWNDFDFPKKDHNMVYPTLNGVIDTVEWEGYREAVTDVRYMTTLQYYIKAAKKAGGEKAGVALEAEKFVNDLKKRDVNRDDADLDILRLRMIDYLIKLTAKPKGK